MDDDPLKRPSMDLFSVAAWSYAPFNLRHLRPPVPSDLPNHHDASVFAFEDAFEDLLAVSQGGELPDIHTKYSQRRLLRQMYPQGEPLWFWLRRLESQGLLQRSPGLLSHHHVLNPDDLETLGSHILDSAFARLNWPEWDAPQDSFGRRVSQPRRRVRDGGDDGEHGSGSILDELHRTFHSAFHGPGKDSPRSNPSQFDNGEDPEGRFEGRQRGLLPDTFDDLFSAISSGLAEGHKTWDTFVKTITDHKKTLHPTEEKNGLRKTRQDDGSEHGENKEVVTRDEHVDQFGYLHTTVTRKTYDRQGNEIGCSTHFTMRPAEKEAGIKGAQKEEEDHDAHVIDRRESEDERPQKPDEKKQGWFWK